MKDNLSITFSRLISEGVRASTVNGGWTEYMLAAAGGRSPSKGKKGVLTPFPSFNFTLTSPEHQKQVRKAIEEAGYDFYVPDKH